MKVRIWVGSRLPALGLYVLIYGAVVALFAAVGLYRFAGLTAPIAFLVCLLRGDQLLDWLTREPTAATNPQPASPAEPEDTP